MTIYWIDTKLPGRLGIATRPRGGEWLREDILGLKANAVHLVVCLLEESELRDLDLLVSVVRKYRPKESDGFGWRPRPPQSEKA